MSVPYFGRLLTAMVTPMFPDGRVDYDGAEKLANYLVEHGSDGIVAAGSTGESATLSCEEKLELFRVVAGAVGKRARVIAGTGSNDTAASVEMTKAAAKTGVHGAMLVGPYYNKPPQEGFYQHFASIAAQTDLPLIVYNVPGRTASNILPATVARLAKIPNIVALKEAAGQMEQVSELLRVLPEDFTVYSGDDSLTLPMMAVGAHGVISVAGHIIGQEMQQMMTAFQAGDVKKAAQLHRRLTPFFKVIFVTTNPIPIKAAVGLKGLPAGPTRLPLIAPTPDELEKIRAVMNQVTAINQ